MTGIRRMTEGFIARVVAGVPDAAGDSLDAALVRHREVMKAIRDLEIWCVWELAGNTPRSGVFQ